MIASTERHREYPADQTPGAGRARTRADLARAGRPDPRLSQGFSGRRQEAGAGPGAEDAARPQAPQSRNREADCEAGGAAALARLPEAGGTGDFPRHALLSGHLRQLPETRRTAGAAASR